MSAIDRAAKAAQAEAWTVGGALRDLLDERAWVTDPAASRVRVAELLEDAQRASVRLGIRLADLKLAIEQDVAGADLNFPHADPGFDGLEPVT
jgi:hypothetical protein